MNKFYYLLFAVLMFCGCATTTGAKNLSQDSVSSIINGRTTKAEVIQLLGKPSSKVTMNNSMPSQVVGGVDISKSMPYEIWTYVKIVEDAKSGLGYALPQTTSLAVNFDREGIVQNYSMVETA